MQGSGVHSARRALRATVWAAFSGRRGLRRGHELTKPVFVGLWRRELTLRICEPARLLKLSEAACDPKPSHRENALHASAADRAAQTATGTIRTSRTRLTLLGRGGHGHGAAFVKQLTFSEVRVGYPRCVFRYDLRGITVTRYLDVSSLSEEAFRAADQSTVTHLVAQIGLAYMPQLFALDDFDVVTVRPLWLSSEGIEFYETLIQRGLAELRFRNGLDLEKRVIVNVEPAAPRYQPARHSPSPSALLLNGGGKDTAVAAELLQAVDLPFVWFTFGRTEAMSRLIDLSGSPCAITLRHGGSLKVLRTRTRYAGHTPFTSLVAFTSLLAAFVARHKYIVAANEYSANFGNVVHDGFEVNHQYPKSQQFESAFARYVSVEILPDVRYFSILRPLYEIQIAKLFAHHSKYFEAFRSCNQGHKRDRWCLRCPKCAFILIALAPHFSERQLISVFGLNAFALRSLQRWIVKLCDHGIRPFECVGTRNESLVALSMAHRRHCDDRFITSLYDECCTGKTTPGLESQYMDQLERPCDIPPELSRPVMDYFRDQLVTAT